MPKKPATKRATSPKKVGDVGANGRKVTRIKKVGSRTYYFYGQGSATTKASKRPKPSLLGSGMAQKAASKTAAHNKRTKARIAKMRGK